MAEKVETKPSKKTVVQFAAGWVPPEGEAADPNCAVTGMIQVIGDAPTDQVAHVVVRDYENEKPTWWPGVTVPGKKKISFGPAFAEAEFCGTDLHQSKIKPGSTFGITFPDGTRATYRIEKVEDLCGAPIGQPAKP